MSQEDRRAFLRKIAKSVVYSAPLIYSMAAPLAVVGQGGGKKGSPHGMGMDMDMDMGMGMDMGKGGMTDFVSPPGSAGTSTVPPGSVGF